jgi:hypothetical protein
VGKEFQVFAKIKTDYRKKMFGLRIIEIAQELRLKSVENQKKLFGIY